MCVWGGGWVCVDVCVLLVKGALGELGTINAFNLYGVITLTSMHE